MRFYSVDIKGLNRNTTKTLAMVRRAAGRKILDVSTRLIKAGYEKVEENVYDNLAGDALLNTKASQKVSSLNFCKKKVKEVAYYGDVSSGMVLINTATKPTIRLLLYWYLQIVRGCEYNLKILCAPFFEHVYRSFDWLDQFNKPRFIQS